MTSPKDNIIIAEHGIITQEALLAYLNDELSVEQKQQLEQLLKNDPFSQDALEGMRSAQDKGAVSSSLTDIRRKVNERIGKKERRMIPFHWSNYAYAAVILGLLVSVAFILTMYINSHRDNIAMNKPEEQTAPQQQEQTKEAPPVVAATPPADTVKVVAPASGSVANLVTTKEKNKKSEGNQGAVTLQRTSSDSSKAKEGFAALLGNPSVEKKEKAAEKLNVAPVADGSFNNNANAANIAEESGANDINKRGQMTSTPTVNNNQTPNARMDAREAKSLAPATPRAEDKSAQQSFFAGEYKRSEVQFDSVLQKEPDNSEALFFGGISDYVNGNLDKADGKFDKLLKSNKKFVDGSKWYKANILLKKGQKDAGINLLQELAHSKGSYKDRAQKKLTELQ